jgi:hypothetical protein
MSTDHVHRQRAPRRAGPEAVTTGDDPVRPPASGHGEAHGGHGMLAMLACCVAIGLVFLLIALGIF